MTFAATLLHGGEVRTVALSALLAPIQDTGPAEKRAQPEAAPVETTRAEFRVLRLSDILRAMEEELSHDIYPAEQLSLSSNYNWTGLRIADTVDWGVRIESAFDPRANGRWYPLFELVADGRPIGKYRIPIHVSHVKKVWVIDQNIARGDLVSRPAIKAESRDIYAERGSLIDAKERLEGFEASRSLTRGRVLTWEDLEERPQVRKNSIVDVEYQNGALEIHMRGRAMEDGMHGDLVTIRNLESSREFVAQVNGESRVKFEN